MRRREDERKIRVVGKREKKDMGISHKDSSDIWDFCCLRRRKLLFFPEFPMSSLVLTPVLWGRHYLPF